MLRSIKRRFVWKIGRDVRTTGKLGNFKIQNTECQTYISNTLSACLVRAAFLRANAASLFVKSFAIFFFEWDWKGFQRYIDQFVVFAIVRHIGAVCENAIAARLDGEQVGPETLLSAVIPATVRTRGRSARPMHIIITDKIGSQTVLWTFSGGSLVLWYALTTVRIRFTARAPLTSVFCVPLKIVRNATLYYSFDISRTIVLDILWYPFEKDRSWLQS